MKASTYRPKILVVDNYDSFTWNLVHYLEELGAETSVIRNDAVTVEEVLASGYDGIVISPGPCTPNEAGISVELVEKAPNELPIFGVCLGHQSIAQAYGGTVSSAMEILHGKTSAITHEGGDMFKGIPRMFSAVRYHSLAILPEGFPDSLKVEARTDDGEIMAVSHTDRPVFGVQFHPESIGSEHGHRLLDNFLRLTRATATS
ncbi:MAG: aminodeoxychorismate/anthranilate synthase component II [Hirschia sp.]|nr:aminodeoxychorismate/anthranilate synthase component II [Hirschia sp.]MBF18014.1 aminodeoxychorismate/anthranilate synthase component II [Hirschia sp.]|tara:strand:- start:203 stop:811 length:609 start_codon:yes stop_codon:yes gene_type:complete